LGWLLPLASVGTTLLMARFLYLAWPRAGDEAEPHEAAAVQWSWLVLLILVLAAVWLVPAGQLTADRAALLGQTLTWSNLWPVLVGGAMAGSAWGLAALRHPGTLPAVPPCDIVVIWQPLQRRLAAGWRTMAGRLEQLCSDRLPQLPAGIDPGRCRRRLELGEAVLGSWSAIAAWLVLVGAACYLGWWFS